jgi:hypothetical protein
MHVCVKIEAEAKCVRVLNSVVTELGFQIVTQAFSSFEYSVRKTCLKGK